MGVQSVAVYSDKHASALHVAETDIAVRIGAAPTWTIRPSPLAALPAKSRLQHELSHREMACDAMTGTIVRSLRSPPRPLFRETRLGSTAHVGDGKLLDTGAHHHRGGPDPGLQARAAASRRWRSRSAELP